MAVHQRTAGGEDEGRGYLGVGRTVFVLGIISLLTDISSEMIYPLVPLFLTSELGAPVAIVGLIEGLAESATSVLRAGSGWLSDRLRARKLLVLMGYSLSTAGKALLAVAYVWPVVLLARTADRAGKGIRTAPRDALIADATPLSSRGRAFGFHRAADTLGAVGGPSIALALLAISGDRYRLVFLLALLPAILSVGVISFVRERSPERAADALPVPLRELGTPFYAFIAVSALFAFGNSSDVFLVLRAQDTGLSAKQVVLAYMTFNAVYALLAMPAGIISDRIGRRTLIALGYLLFAAVYFGFGVNQSAALVWPLFAVYGLHMALMEGVSRALVTDFVPAQGRATALGIYHGVLGGMVLLASVVAGLLWDQVGPGAPFVLGGATALAALALFLSIEPLLPARAIPTS